MKLDLLCNLHLQLDRIFITDIIASKQSWALFGRINVLQVYSLFTNNFSWNKIVVRYSRINLADLLFKIKFVQLCFKFFC